MSRNYNNGIQDSLRFTDIILVIGVGVSIFSLIVNQNNNDVLDKINNNLTKINDSGGLDIIAQNGLVNTVIENK